MTKTMRSFAAGALLSALLMFPSFSPASQAGDLVDTYVARLSDRDHRNSRGDRLTDVAAIIRQDRANFYKYDRRDSEDEGDGFFGKEKNRAVLERLLNRGYCSPSARRAILNGDPLIKVSVYTDHITVSVL